MEKKERINIIISVILILTAASLFFPLSSAFAGQFTGGIGDGDACAEVSLSSLATVPEVVSKIIRAGEEILSISRLNNKVTVVLTNPYPNNNLKPGQYIVIYTGISGTPSFNGRFLIDSVLSQSEFTYQQGGSNESGSIGSFSFAGGDFSTLTSWEADLPYDLASTGTPHIAVCYNDWVSGLKDNLVVEGHTTTPKYYIKITPFRLDRNTGKPKSGFFIAPSSGNAIILQDNADLVLDSIEATAPVVINAGVARVDDRSIYSKLEVGSGATLALSGANFGNLKEMVINAGSTLEYLDGDSSSLDNPIALLNQDHHHLKLSKGFFKLPADNFTIMGNIDIGSQASLDATENNYNIKVAGDWFCLGNFNSRVAGVEFNGTNQKISGSTSFFNFRKDNSGPGTLILTFESASLQTVKGRLDLGRGSRENFLKLRSSQEGSQWELDLQGDSLAGFVNVKDSDASRGNKVYATASLDSGNNDNWEFNSAEGGPIQSVSVSPSSGYRKIGESVGFTIKIKPQYSNSTLLYYESYFGNHLIELTREEDGITFNGSYIVKEGDPDIADPSLSGRLEIMPFGGATSLFSAILSKTTLYIDANKPVVSSGNILVTTSPDNGEFYRAGEDITLTWDNSASGDGSHNPDIALVTADFSALGGSSAVEMSESEGIYTASYTVSAESINGTHDILVTVTDKAGNQTSLAAPTKVRVVSGSLTLTSPTTPVSYVAGTTQKITWNASGDISTVNLKYSIDSGQSYKTINTVGSLTGGNTCDWVVPSDITSKARVKVEDTAIKQVYSASSVDFSIVYPSVTITSPNGGESWTAGSKQNITWTTNSPLVTHLKLEYSVDGGSSWNLIAAAVPNTGSYLWKLDNLFAVDTVRVRATGLARNQMLTLGGSAMDKVSSGAWLEDNYKVLAIEVLSDFNAGDTLLISGLKFGNFIVSPANNLKLSAGSNSVIDDKKITVIAPSV